MKIALLNTPSTDTYGPLKAAAGRYFPLGLGYIAGCLRRAGHETVLIDPEAQGQDENAVAARLASFGPDLAGISCATPGFSLARRLARIVRQATPGCVTVLGGVHASALPRAVLTSAPEFDLAAIGEGERTMIELATALQADPPSHEVFETVPGLAYRNGEEIRKSPEREWIQDLDSLPFPARDLANPDNYVPHAHNRRGRRAATAITSRGCPHRCIFCASHAALGHRFRAHSPLYVVEEISHLARDFRVDQVIFNDDTFTLDGRRALEICDLILKRDLRIKWFCFARVDTVDRELLATMKKAGCFSVGFGVEAGDNGLLRAARKKVTVEQTRQAVAWANDLGLKSQCFFVFGLPGETEDTLRRTTDLAIDLKPALAFFNMMVPYPGTEAYSLHFGNPDAAPSAVHWEDWVAVGPRATIHVAGAPSLERAVANANRRFYLRPAQILRMLRHVTNPTELIQLLRGALALAAQVLLWRRT